MNQLISKIKNEGINLREKTEEELSLKIEKIKKCVKVEGIDNILSEWFAMVQEVSFRQIGLRHFDTQLLAGFSLHEGNIIEMKTGEGKTLASTLAVSLNALTKNGVHVVTVNDYLAERDQKWMGKIYSGLGLTSGLVKSTSTTSEKKRSYNSDITYLTNSELVFDFLRDTSSSYKNEIVQRPFSYCVIDEIDSILIDEARTPLILSTSQEKTKLNKLYLARYIANLLEIEIDFQVDEKRKDINLTEGGYNRVKEKLGKRSLYENDDPWILEILNALKAKYIFKLNKDYIVLNNKVLIVDEFTGRIMEDRRWSLGIHEAVETKENVQIGGETTTKSSITYQNFFTLYPKLAGMTGTAKTAEKEFKEIYNLDVVVIPTAKSLARKDISDFVYQTELSKWKAVLTKAKECYEKEQPILIGTASVEKSEFLSELFKISKVPHQVLNAKPENVGRESEIIAQAGKRAAVTIATNMAGRGTDIILGGNPMFEVKQKISDLFAPYIDPDTLKHEKKEYKKELKELIKGETKNKNKENQEVDENLIKLALEEYKEKKSLELLEKDIESLPFSLESSLPSLQSIYNLFYKNIYPKWENENNVVKNLGGLFVLGTERHETRRIDNQLRGRAGRQGDPGYSQFFVSLDDELLQVFGGDNIKNWVKYLIEEKDAPLESDLLTKSLETAQKKVENYNYDLRKNIFQYDDILNNQRKQFFKARNEILCTNIFQEIILRYSESFFDENLKWIEKNLKKEKQSKNSTEGKTLSLESTLSSFVEECFDDYALYSFEKSTKIKNKARKKEKNQENQEKQEISLRTSCYKEIWISFDLRLAHYNFYEENFIKKNRLSFFLSILDSCWTEHLERMNYIRETINWRSYGQQNPLIEYNNEAFQSFNLMFNRIRASMLYYLLNNPMNE